MEYLEILWSILETQNDLEKNGIIFLNQSYETLSQLNQRIFF